MYEFPDSLYCDVRIEQAKETNVMFSFGKLQDIHDREYEAAFLRVFDGQRWYYSATTAIDSIQEHIYGLANVATPQKNIEEHPTVKRMEANRQKNCVFCASDDVNQKSLKEKIGILTHYLPFLEKFDMIKYWTAIYADEKKIKRFYSSKGACLEFDYQRVGLFYGYKMNFKENHIRDNFNCGGNYWKRLENQESKMQNTLKRSVDFLKRAKSVQSGRFPVILSPMAAGIFAHESFGHLSEADSFHGDETLKKQWIIGKKVADEKLSIVDDGSIQSIGYTPYDDEGTKARKTYLIKEGILNSRLHSIETASDFNEEPTGNARAVSFEYEPIVRMTNTYIEAGKKTLYQLISEVDNGFLIETIKSGSGSTNFAISPSIAYRIKKGTIAEPVKIAVITGNSFESLYHIDGVSDDVQLSSSPFIGCAKNDQPSLPIDFGGPYVRVSDIHVLG